MNNYTWNKYNNNKQPYSTKGKRKSVHKSVTKPCETEEKAIIRRFRDARRMARFRARKRKDLEEAKTFEIGHFNELSAISELKRKSVIFKNVDSIVTIPNITQFQSNLFIKNPLIIVHPPYRQSKYSQLLTVIQELGKDIKLTYAGSKISAERIKLGIVKARMLIKECLLETELNSQ